jgi:hypothetical protein
MAPAEGQQKNHWKHDKRMDFPQEMVLEFSNSLVASGLGIFGSVRSDFLKKLGVIRARWILNNRPPKVYDVSCQYQLIALHINQGDPHE